MPKLDRILFLILAAGWIGAAADDCDDDKKPKEGTPAVAIAPTPEKLAGMSEGALRICAIPKTDVSEIPISISFPEQNEKPIRLDLKKGEKGYCEYWRASTLSRLWSNGMQFNSDASLTEVGVYYTAKYNENPKAEDLTYAKAAQLQDGSFRLNVRIITETPWIEVHAR